MGVPGKELAASSSFSSHCRGTKSPASATQPAIAPDQRVGRAVVLKLRLSGTL